MNIVSENLFDGHVSIRPDWLDEVVAFIVFWSSESDGSKINELDLEVFVDKNIAILNIAMANILVVEEFDSLDDVFEDSAYVISWKQGVYGGKI